MLSYALAPVSVTLNLATNSLSGSDAAGDIIQGFEIFEGSAWNDTITVATSISQSLRGLAGKDTLTCGDRISWVDRFYKIKRRPTQAVHRLGC
jgi:hypothetical protein